MYGSCNRFYTSREYFARKEMNPANSSRCCICSCVYWNSTKEKISSTCLNLAEDTVASLKSFHWDPRELIFREIYKGNQWPHIQLIAITTTDELVCKLNIPLPLVDSTYLLTCQIVLRSRAIRWSFCLISFHYCSHGNHPGEFYHKEPNTSKSQPIISAERHKTLSASILHSGNKMKYS